MSDQQPSVQVVQCPKCGSPVESGRPGAITSCSYCGSPLQLSVGASGHPIARLANIETSTVYLARTEALKRVREQLTEAELGMSAMREDHDAKRRVLNALKPKNKLELLLFGTTVLLISAFAIFNDSTVCGYAGLALGIVLLLLAWVPEHQAESQYAHLEQELAQLVERYQQLRAERDRLKARIIELEEGLDDAAEQL